MDLFDLRDSLNLIIIIKSYCLAWFYESKVNQNISNSSAATKALRNAAEMSEKIGDEGERREHKALIGEALTEVFWTISSSEQTWLYE